MAKKISKAQRKRMQNRKKHNAKNRQKQLRNKQNKSIKRKPSNRPIGVKPTGQIIRQKTRIFQTDNIKSASKLLQKSSTLAHNVDMLSKAKGEFQVAQKELYKLEKSFIKNGELSKYEMKKLKRIAMNHQLTLEQYGASTIKEISEKQALNLQNETQLIEDIKQAEFLSEVAYEDESISGDEEKAERTIAIKLFSTGGSANKHYRKVDETEMIAQTQKVLDKSGVKYNHKKIKNIVDFGKEIIRNRKQ